MKIAIDPGANGGIVVETANGTVHAWKMPATDTDKIDLFKKIKAMRKDNEKIEVWKEKIGGFAGGRKVARVMKCKSCGAQNFYTETQGDPGSRMFNFGDGNGFIRCLALVIGATYHKEIPPRNWQKAFNVIKSRDESKTAWKNRLKDLAQKHFPGIKVTLAISDALLMLEYVRMGGG